MTRPTWGHLLAGDGEVYHVRPEVRHCLMVGGAGLTRGAGAVLDEGENGLVDVRQALPSPQSGQV